MVHFFRNNRIIRDKKNPSLFFHMVVIEIYEKKKIGSGIGIEDRFTTPLIIAFCSFYCILVDFTNFTSMWIRNMYWCISQRLMSVHSLFNVHFFCSFIRLEWDQYITEDNTPLASSIPINWVIPPLHPSKDWAQYQNWAV